MKASTVNKRYFKNMMVSSLGYVVTLLVVSAFINKDTSPVWLAITLTLIPAFFVLLMLRAIWVYIGEVDEAQRFFLTKSLLIGLFTVLALSGTWGLIEMMSNNLPRIQIFWIFPLFFFAFGLSQCFGPGRGMGMK